MRILAPLKLKDNNESSLFRTEFEYPDIIVNIEVKDDLGTPEGRFLGLQGEKSTWCRDDVIIRQVKDYFRPFPHAEVVYKMSSPDKIQLNIRKEYLSWAVSAKYLWTGLFFNDIILYFRSFMIHASYINYKGDGILFTAPSGTGKSTQAELWRKFMEAEVVNGDKAAVSVRESGVTACSVPFSGSSGICNYGDWPLKAIVVVRQSPENHVRQLRPVEAIKQLSVNVFVPDIIPYEQNLLMKLLIDMLAEVKIYLLECTPDENAVKALYKTIYEKGEADSDE